MSWAELVAYAVACFGFGAWSYSAYVRRQERLENEARAERIRSRYWRHG